MKYLYDENIAIQEPKATNREYLFINENNVNVILSMIDDLTAFALKEKENKKNEVSVNKNEKKKGDLLELVINKIIESTGIFDRSENVRTTTNEIDTVVKLNFMGKHLRSIKLIPLEFPDYFIIECKNYYKKVGITFIEKFYSLLKSSAFELGIFISTFGIAGDESLHWSYAQCFIKKMALIFHHKVDKTGFPKIISINLEKIHVMLKDSDKRNIVELICDEDRRLISDLSHNCSYIHENCGKINIETVVK